MINFYHPDLFDIRRAAEVIGITAPTMYHHANRGNVKSTKLDGRYLILRPDLEAFIQARNEGRFLNSTGRPRKVKGVQPARKEA